MQFVPTVLSDITGIGADPIFTPKNMPSLAGQVWVVTGGHAGIGLATTQALARAGATVHIASRTASKVQEAIKANPGLALEFVEVNLSDLKSVKRAGATLAKLPRLDGIVLNAGVMATPYRLTADGVEEQFQINHLAHFALVQSLMPLLEKTGAGVRGKPARIVALSSFAHNFFSFYPFASPSFDSLASVNRAYDPLGYIRYSQAKLSNILFVRELNNRSTHVKGIAVHPGFVASGLYDHQAMFKPLTATFISTEEGAYSSLFAASSPAFDQDPSQYGSYVVPFAKIKRTTSYGEDKKLAQDLWTLSEALVREKTA